MTPEGAGVRPAAGVVLAAGAGVRLRPLTDLRPKALCPVGGTPLVDLALARLAPLTGTGRQNLAVNAHHLAGQLVAHLRDRAAVSVEAREALGTAGALAALRAWIGGRDVLVTNADAYLPGGLGRFADGWDRQRPRLLCRLVETGRADFTRADGTALRYIGACLLPWPDVARLVPVPSGLYEVLWRDQAARGELDLVTPAEVGAGEVAVDCGSVADYLRANLHASGGHSVIGRGATVLGTVERCVVWDGARVGPGEHLVDAVRAGSATRPVTALAVTASHRRGVSQS